MNSSSSAPSYPWSMVCLIFDPMFQTKIQEHIWSVKCGVNLAQKLCRYPNLSEASTWSSRWVRQTVRNKPHPQVISRDLAGEIDKHQRHLIIPSYIFASFRLPSDLTGGGGRWNWSSPGTLGQPPFGQLYNIWFLTLFASLTIVQLRGVLDILLGAMIIGKTLIQMTKCPNAPWKGSNVTFRNPNEDRLEHNHAIKCDRPPKVVLKWTFLGLGLKKPWSPTKDVQK